MDLPPAADAMYKTWWSFVNYAAQARDTSGGYAYTVTDASSAASEVSKTVGGQYQSYNPIGVSQLFSIARKISNATAALSTADPASPITSAHVAEAPWSRPLADQAASPEWQARVAITYTDAAGVQQDGIAVVKISQVLPSSVASLQAQVALRVQDQLDAPPGSGTPRSGTLDAVNSITLLAV